MDTIKDLIKKLENSPSRPNALNYKNSVGVFQPLSTKECMNLIYQIGAALIAMGIKKGDKIAIMSPPTPAWILADLGIMMIGAISVPLFTTITDEHFVYQITETDCKTIFVAGRTGHNICEVHSALFTHIISIDEAAFFSDELLFKEIIDLGEMYLKEHPEIYEITNQPEDLATIVYTSGTTDLPKGAELTHKNIVHVIPSSIEKVSWGQDNDRSVHFLPLAHILGRLMNLTLFASGTPIYYETDSTKIMETCKEIKPTILALIPRMIEKIYNAVKQQIEKQNFIRKRISMWAFNLAHKDKEDINPILFWIADRLVYVKIRNIFGGNLRSVLSGSAKSNATLLKFFYNAGVPIMEGYGLTEACPALSNELGFNFGSIGKPLKEIEVKIDSNGEILLRGPVVMRGYYKNPELTKKVLDSDGWFHTSDLGSVDSEGNITVTGRSSEMCKSSYGEYVNMPLIESRLNQIYFVDAAVVIARDRPFVTALLFIDTEALTNLKKIGFVDLSDEEILRMELVKKNFERELNNINSHLDEWEKVRDYRFIFKKATIEDKELSPTMKIKRQFIESKYEHIINEMYPTKAVMGVTL